MVRKEKPPKLTKYEEITASTTDITALMVENLVAYQILQYTHKTLLKNNYLGYVVIPVAFSYIISASPTRIAARKTLKTVSFFVNGTKIELEPLTDTESEF